MLALLPDPTLRPEKESAEKKKKRSRGGAWHRLEKELSEGSPYLMKRFGLLLRALRNGEGVTTKIFDIVQDGVFSKTGWQGGKLKVEDAQGIMNAYNTGFINQIFADCFYPVHYNS